MARTASRRKTAGKGARKGAVKASRKAGMAGRGGKQTAAKPTTRRAKPAAKAASRNAKLAVKSAPRDAKRANGPKGSGTTPRRAQSTAKPRVSARKQPQRFTVSHHKEQGFRTDGLRSYARYRDLGIAAATDGLCQAHVIRFLGPCTDEVRKRHFHEPELQLVYVLKGWMKNEFEGHGEQLMQAGSCWVQPPGIKHTVLDFSDDCEVLEIIVPADFKTVELAG